MPSPTSNNIQTINTGNSVRVRASAVDQVTLLPVSDAAVVVTFYNPAKDPENVPQDRTADHTSTATYDARVKGYVASLTTDNTWAPGVWTYLATFTGTGYVYSQYDQFILRA